MRFHDWLFRYATCLRHHISVVRLAYPLPHMTPLLFAFAHRCCGLLCRRKDSQIRSPPFSAISKLCPLCLSVASLGSIALLRFVTHRYHACPLPFFACQFHSIPTLPRHCQSSPFYSITSLSVAQRHVAHPLPSDDLPYRTDTKLCLCLIPCDPTSSFALAWLINTLHCPCSVLLSIPSPFPVTLRAPIPWRDQASLCRHESVLLIAIAISRQSVSLRRKPPHSPYTTSLIRRESQQFASTHSRCHPCFAAASPSFSMPRPCFALACSAFALDTTAT